MPRRSDKDFVYVKLEAALEDKRDEEVRAAPRAVPVVPAHLNRQCLAASGDILLRPPLLLPLLRGACVTHLTNAHV